MKRLPFILAFAASLLLIAAMLFTSLQLCMNDEGWYRRQYERMRLPDEIGISAEDITKALMRLIDYMEGRVGSIQLTVTEDGSRVEMYNERETLHMLDVRDLYQAWRSVRDFGVMAAAVLLFTSLYLTQKGGRLRLLSRAFLWASAAFGALLAAVAIFASVDFNAFWTAFHHVFFDNDLWLLSYQTDRMIRICPAELFSGIISRFALFFLIPFAALFVAAFFGKRGARKAAPAPEGNPMRYDELARVRAGEYRNKAHPLTLAIESSCDETAASVLRGAREVLSSSVYTQIALHRKYGGVVPELASRSHVEKIGAVVADALERAGTTLAGVDAVAATSGPGLVGALLVGLSYAKGLAYAAGKPMVGVDHIAGHIATNYLTYADLAPPFVCLVASGGHSHIVLVEDYCRFSLLGRTRDDAAGEAFDKVARALGLPYPGGPALEALAKEGDPQAHRFRMGLSEDDSFDFSFSGVKTAVVNLLHTANQRGEQVRRADVAASFQRAVVDALCAKSVRAAGAAGVSTLALAGGVSANATLREALRQRAEAEGLRFCVPEPGLCADNAAMIACAGHYALLCGAPDPLSINAHPSRELA